MNFLPPPLSLSPLLSSESDTKHAEHHLPQELEPCPPRRPEPAKRPRGDSQIPQMRYGWIDVVAESHMDISGRAVLRCPADLCMGFRVVRSRGSEYVC